jgi:hypothetical protein
LKQKFKDKPAYEFIFEKSDESEYDDIHYTLEPEKKKKKKKRKPKQNQQNEQNGPNAISDDQESENEDEERDIIIEGTQDFMAEPFINDADQSSVPIHNNNHISTDAKSIEPPTIEATSQNIVGASFKLEEEKKEVYPEKVEIKPQLDKKIENLQEEINKPAAFIPVEPKVEPKKEKKPVWPKKELINLNDSDDD